MQKGFKVVRGNSLEDFGNSEQDHHQKYLNSRKNGGQRRRSNIKRDKQRNENKYL